MTINSTDFCLSLSFPNWTGTKVFPLYSFFSFLCNTEREKYKNSVGFSSGVSTVMAFHGSGFLATLYLAFIKNLTNETRLLLSFSVIIWFKEIKDRRKTKSRFWGKPRGWKTGLVQSRFSKCYALRQGSFQ